MEGFHRSVPDSPGRVAVAELCLITGHDSLASHLHHIGITSSPLCILRNENEIMPSNVMCITNSMAYGTRRFNATFTRVL